MLRTQEDYSEQDLLSNNSFLIWLNDKETPEGVFWETWLGEHPEKGQTVKNAVMAYRLSLVFDKNIPQDGECEEVWDGIRKRLELCTRENNYSVPARFKTWLMYAAVVAGIVCIMLAGVRFWTGRKTSVASLSSVKKITLPDGSLAVLNTNSRLSYHKDLDSRKLREVWVEGKVFFEVRSKSRDDKLLVPFVVHLGTMDIKVLGTSFNVLLNDTLSMVILSEGKIQAAIENQEITLEAGDLLKVTGSQISKEKVNSDLYSAWKDGIFRFNHTGIDEIAALLNNYYGFKVILEDREALKGKIISGEISAKDLDALFNAIDVIMGMEALRKNNTVIIRDK